MDKLLIPPFSRIIAGTMTWGAWGKKLSSAAIAKNINSYLEIGISTFDHADIYGGYTTEADFGTGLRESGVRRESVQLISKFGIQLPSKARPIETKHYDVSPEHMKHSVDQSLRNLKTDYLDLLLIHRPSPLMEAGEIAQVVNELIESKKILRFGVSNFTASQLSLLLSQVEVSVNQIEFSLSKPEPLNSGIFEYHKLCGLQTLAWAPLGNVFKESTEQSERIIKIINKLSLKYEASPEELLIAWICRLPAHIHPVIGTTDPARAKLSVEALHIELDKEDWFSMLEASLGKETA